MSWLGLLLIILSLMGYNGSIRRLGVSPYLAWITSILVQILLDYVFAMLGLLRLGLRLVTLFGVLLLVIRLILGHYGKGALKFEGVHSFDFWMVSLGLVMAYELYHSPLVHYDNFSHWAVIVKFLTFTGRLPGAHDAIISFTSYPPAMALWLTQMVTWTGYSEGAMLVAQFGLIWAASYAVFNILRDRTRGLTSFILCLTIAVSYVFNINIRLNNLLVDYVLPIITVAGLVGIYVYRKQPWHLSAHVAIFSASLLLVKNSAAFFVAVLAVYFLYELITNAQGHWYWKLFSVPARFMVTLAAALAPFLWWEWHVKTTFTESKHEISAQAYSHQLSGEGTGHIVKIGEKFLHQILSLNSLSTQGIILINVILFVAWFIIRHRNHQRNQLLGMMILLDFVFILYYGSLFGMYILSMPYAEAIMLDGFERYMSSTVILNLFIGAMVLVRALDRTFYEQDFSKRDLRAFKSIVTKNAYQLGTFLMIFFAIIMMYSEINGTKYTNIYNRGTLPIQLDKTSKPWTKLSHTKILIVDPHPGDVDSYYAGYLANYYYFTDKAVGQENFMESKSDFKKNVLRYQYVVIPEYHHTFTVMVRKVFHQHVRTGLYKVEQDGLERKH
ncbi:mutg family lantibiotic protection abc superfamily atp binding cassette transporter permease [Levilactobacillus koreensis JCM 16448]|uniref:ABC transporter permease n=1 Tax=Levilactobacillus koreensis TaxID=637971 RepID=A0AAC8UUF0_9LACO|nr:hypothetical protein [Levilactobacillus koreensis]AKP64640.1 ABC transporter permease [Levilactobacillus koreensis]KRK91348.1 mutg family lantibiotic protection abc superfamily atp binding cassette transporter permease [Levilactobacillus koreensis JCM 16448]